MYNELLTHTKKEFEKLGEDSRLKPFLAARPAARVKAKDALVFARILISETSKRGHELNEKIHVSEACDCGLLNPSRGFIVIPGNAIVPSFEALKPTIDITETFATDRFFREKGFGVDTLLESHRDLANEAVESMREVIAASTHLDSSMFAFRIPGIETPPSLPTYIPARQQQREDGAAAFLGELQTRTRKAEEQARREGGTAEILCTTPSGKVMERFRVSYASPYFVRIEGIDREGQRHNYEVDYSHHGISIEVMESFEGDGEDNGSSSNN